MTKPDDRERILTQTRNLKMARSAHAYVRGSTVKFYDWLKNSRPGELPEVLRYGFAATVTSAILVPSPMLRAMF
jgi:uncharacterized protein (DUF2252 family)